MVGGIFGVLISNISFFVSNKSLNYYFFSFFSSSIWFMPILSTIGSVYFPVERRMRIFKRIDQGWAEFFGAQQIFVYFISFSRTNQVFQFNNVKIYFTLFLF